jgi:hypothetical protein
LARHACAQTALETEKSQQGAFETDAEAGEGRARTGCTRGAPLSKSHRQHVGVVRPRHRKNRRACIRDACVIAQEGRNEKSRPQKQVAQIIRTQIFLVQVFRIKDGQTEARLMKRAAKQTRRTTARAHKAEKDPRGGLTAAGRRAFARKQGAHLKPSVKKKLGDMTLQEMRRKGSWAVRFYGRSKLPPLVDENGKPTRHALSAHAWGEPVPRTVGAARKIAAKGKRLLARYERLKAARR